MAIEAGRVRVVFEAVGIQQVNAQMTTLNRTLGRVSRTAIAFAALFVGRQFLSGIKTLINDLGELSLGMAEIQRTTGIAGAGLNEFREELLDLSAQMAGSIEDIQDAAIALGRAGVTSREELLAGIKISAKFGTITGQAFGEVASQFVSLSRILEHQRSLITLRRSAMRWRSQVENSFQTQGRFH